MRLKSLSLKNFGPFETYSIDFIDEETCILLTGKNNEGKTTILNALKFIDSATRVIGKNKQKIIIDNQFYFSLLKQDTENIIPQRLIYNYRDIIAEIVAELNDNFRITVLINPFIERIYSYFEGRIPSDIQKIFGFIPPLGPLSENEDILTKQSYIRANFRTSLAPRHLRNHLHQILTKEEYALVKTIIGKSWEGIELEEIDVNYIENKITTYYSENRISREICWAGQGLQIWFQIITHLVRLRDYAILILDEPEINLHPEKQNDLLRIITEYFQGSIIIATHSVELMNNVYVSHILHIQKLKNKPKIKTTSDRTFLNQVRSKIGSNFNLIASQYEEFDIIIFTEDTYDYSIIRTLAKNFGIDRKAFNIPLHGFKEYKKASVYKESYELLIGKHISYSIVLDRDYYPEDYLNEIKKELKKVHISTIFTPGKEIENILIAPNLVNKIIPKDFQAELDNELDKFYTNFYHDSLGSFITLYKSHLDSRIDTKTITKKYVPIFDKQWNDKKFRHFHASGKNLLKMIRNFYRSKTKENISQEAILSLYDKDRDKEIFEWVCNIYNIPVELI